MGDAERDDRPVLGELPMREWHGAVPAQPHHRGAGPEGIRQVCDHPSALPAVTDGGRGFLGRETVHDVGLLEDDVEEDRVPEASPRGGIQLCLLGMCFVYGQTIGN